MEDEELEIIYDEAKRQRVIFFRKRTGTFYYEEEYFSDELDEMCWIPKSRRIVGIYDSQSKAQTEAKANIEWLKNF